MSGQLLEVACIRDLTPRQPILGSRGGPIQQPTAWRANRLYIAERVSLMLVQ